MSTYHVLSPQGLVYTWAPLFGLCSALKRGDEVICREFKGFGETSRFSADLLDFGAVCSSSPSDL